MPKEKFNPEIISEDNTGIVYSLSSGSGGFHASFEEVRVKRTSESQYFIEFVTPSGSEPISEEVSDAEDTIRAARAYAAENVYVGMPGSDLIEIPAFDFTAIPDEP